MRRDGEQQVPARAGMYKWRSGCTGHTAEGNVAETKVRVAQMAQPCEYAQHHRTVLFKQLKC